MLNILMRNIFMINTYRTNLLPIIFITSLFTSMAAAVDHDGDGLEAEFENNFEAIQDQFILISHKRIKIPIPTYTFSLSDSDPNDALLDTDADGIPDWYEHTNGLDYNADDAGEDMNGNGISNYIDYLASAANNQQTDLDGLFSTNPAHHQCTVGAPTPFYETRIAHDESVGMLTGQFDVSPKGAATYSIPLPMPPGVNGIQPNLSLNYNSQGPNGPLGLGWALGGLSEITRCPADELRDGYRDPVDLDDNDQFCLDGGRLMLVSGQHGAPGAVYRTEIASNNIITLHRYQLNGHLMFKVDHGDGSYTWYGKHPNTLTRYNNDPHGTPVSWGISSRGSIGLTGSASEMIYDYNGKDTAAIASGVHRVKHIRYGDYEITLEWASRPDPFFGYGITNVKYAVQERISAIIVKINALQSDGLEVTRYKIHYSNHHATSLITHVEQCHTANRCISSARFVPETNPGGFGDTFTAPQTEIDFGFNEGRQWVDFNGDGLADLCRVTGSNGRFKLNCSVNIQATGLSTIESTAFIDPGYLSGRAWVDFNGDALTDFCRVVNVNHLRCTPSNGHAFSSQYVDTYIADAGYEDSRAWVDANGDGRSDYCAVVNQNGYRLKCVISNGAGFHETQQSAFNIDPGFSATRRWTDVTGDGLADYCRTVDHGAGRRVQCTVKTAAGFGETLTSDTINEGAEDSRQWVDFNNDGKDDYCRMVDNRITCTLSTGASFGETLMSQHVVDPGYGYSRRWLDYNSDRFIDYCRVIGVPNHFRIACTLGSATGFRETIESYPLDPGFHDTGSWADITGDGRLDYVRKVGQQQNAQIQVTPIQDNITPQYIGIESTLGADIAIHYSHLTANDHYHHDYNLTGYPVIQYRSALSVVGHVDQETGSHDAYGNPIQHRKSYRYTGNQFHVVQGSLGFRSFRVTDHLNHIQETTHFSQDPVARTVGMPILYEKKSIAPNVPGHPLLSSIVSDVASENLGAGVYFPHITRTTIIARDLDNRTNSVTTTENHYGQWGDAYSRQPNREVSCVSAEYHSRNFSVTKPCASMGSKLNETTTTNHYHHIGHTVLNTPLLSRQTVQSSVFHAHIPYQDNTETRTKAFTYYYDTGLLKEEIIEPDHPQLTLTTTRHYNNRLKLISETVSGHDIGTRTTAYTYEGPYPLRRRSMTNALGHTTEYRYDNSLYPWIATRTIDSNGLQTYSELDPFGTVKKTTSAYGSSSPISSATSKAWCHTNNECAIAGAEQAVYFTLTTQSASTTGAPVESLVFYDKFNREILAKTIGLYDIDDYRFVYQQTEYDALSRIVRVSEPYFDNDPIYNTTTTYDPIGRPLIITDPEGHTREFFYRGFKVKNTINAGGTIREQWVIKNALGQILEKRDHEDNRILFSYDAFGHLVKTEDPENNTLLVGYNIRGQKTKMDDPDTGYWTYQHYADGRLKSQTDAQGQTTQIDYDALGRMIRRVDHDGSSDHWEYDHCANGVGQLCRAYSSNDHFDEQYQYNDLSLPWYVVTQLDGINHASSTCYDALQRVKQVRYPSGYQIENHYDEQLGHLSQTKKSGTNTILWAAKAFNAKGQMESFALADGLLKTTRLYEPDSGRLDQLRIFRHTTAIADLDYTWDPLGNLQQVADVSTGLTSDYTYDSLNRLTHYTTALHNTDYLNVAVNYDSLGNITYKSDVGHYTYNQSHCGQTAGPHAVSQISGQGNYCYNANGSLISGNGQTLQWTPFNKTKQIQKNGNTSVFHYAPSRQRYKRTDTGEQQKTTYYLGNYEKQVVGSTTTHRIYLGNYAIIEKINSAPEKAIYTLRDHLGSVMMTFDNADQATTRLNYDPWGKRLFIPLPNAIAIDPTSLSTLATPRGFTGHEHIDTLGLIDMNGRIFDPTIARFLSADPLIQSPSYLQSYNRYSYTLNNPLVFTDPSGYSWVKDKWKQIRRAAIVAGSAFVTYFGCGPCGKIGAAAAASSAYTYRSAKDHGVGTNDAFKNALRAGATAYLVGKASVGIGADYPVLGAENAIANFPMNALLHGSVGGLAAVANNGKFKTGFLTSLGTTAFVKMPGVGVGHYLSKSQMLVTSTLVSAAIAKDQDGDPWFSVGMAMIQAYFNAAGGQKDDWTKKRFGKGNHKYNRLSSVVCDASQNGCTQQSVVMVLNSNGVHPNQSNAFIPGEEYIADVNIPGPFGKDHISTTAIYNSDEAQIGIRNETMMNHALHPGVVERTVILRNGSYHIQTQGGGYGYMGGPNIWLDDMVWGPVDQAVIDKF